MLSELMRLALIAQPSYVNNEEGMPLLILSLPSHLQVQWQHGIPVDGCMTPHESKESFFISLDTALQVCGSCPCVML